LISDWTNMTARSGNGWAGYWPRRFKPPVP